MLLREMYRKLISDSWNRSNALGICMGVAISVRLPEFAAGESNRSRTDLIVQVFPLSSVQDDRLRQLIVDDLL